MFGGGCKRFSMDDDKEEEDDEQDDEDLFLKDESITVTCRPMFIMTAMAAGAGRKHKKSPNGIHSPSFCLSEANNSIWLTVLSAFFF